MPWAALRSASMARRREALTRSMPRQAASSAALRVVSSGRCVMGPISLNGQAKCIPPRVLRVFAPGSYDA